jgi:hypothetical protein
MTDLLLHQNVRPLDARRLPGGLLSAALPLPPGWENGITFFGVGCAEPQIFGPCTVTDTTEVRPNGQNVFEPVFVQQTAACSRLGNIGTISIADNRLESTTEWAIGHVLATGEASNNPSFADAELVAAQDDVVSAVSCLEQAVADVGFGADGFLHAPMRAAAYLRSNHLLDPITKLSPGGLTWVISPGYPGGTDDGGDSTVTIWATGLVFAGATDVYQLDGLPGWRQNLDDAYAQRVGLAAFDPCLNLSATFVVPACTGGS